MPKVIWSQEISFEFRFLLHSALLSELRADHWRYRQYREARAEVKIVASSLAPARTITCIKITPIRVAVWILKLYEQVKLS
jgi:hypothetical protein